MQKNISVVIAGLLMTGALTLGAATTPMIGMVSSDPGQAGVLIDGARVSSNATLFEGSQVSSTGYSRVQLTSGTRVNLGANSVMRVYANHASLEGGTSELQGGSSYAIDARSLKIQPAEAGAIARVRLDGDQKVLVTAVTAPVNVWNVDGLLVARVLPEAPMSFLPQAAASNAFSNSGCVVNKSNAAVLVDQTGNQVFELRGNNVRNFIGKRANVTGTLATGATPVTGASQVVNVSSITAGTGGDCAPVAARIGGTMTAAGIAGGAAAAGAGAAGGAAAAGVSAAVVGGVVAAAGAAAIVGGLAAAGTFSSSCASGQTGC